MHRRCGYDARKPVARKNRNRPSKTSFVVSFVVSWVPADREASRRPVERARRDMSHARLGDVDSWQSVERPCSPWSRVVWGPVSATAAALAGCARGVVSVCIVPRLTPFLVAAALECIPHDVRAKHTDTVEVLAKRLGRSGFLDDAHVLRGGNGKRKRGQSMRVRLNESTYRAPRRKSWSVVVAGDPDGDAVALFNYNAYGRTADDVRCTAMPQPVFNLGVELWLAAMPHLCEASRAAPPTHCQLLLYYALFNSAMGE